MNGRRALIYARVRVNKLDPADNDITRGERQQAVVQAVADEMTSFKTFLRMPFIGDDLVAPLATDLSANQLLQLAWVKRRTPSSGILRCRLGGTIADIDGQSFIIGGDDNATVVAMVEGKVAPQRPASGSARSAPAVGSAATSERAEAGARPKARKKSRPSTRRVSRRSPSSPPCPPSSIRPLRRRRRPSRPDDGSRGRSRSVKPEPLKWIAAGYRTFVTGTAPHTSQASGGGSVMRWNSSKVWPLGQRYS